MYLSCAEHMCCRDSSTKFAGATLFTCQYFVYAAPDGSPVNVTVANVGPRVVALQWLSPPHDTHNGDITGYVIKTLDIELQTGASYREIDNVTSSTLSGLHTAHSYEFSVAARTVVGWGPFSRPFFIFTLHDGITYLCSFTTLSYQIYCISLYLLHAHTYTLSLSPLSPVHNMTLHFPLSASVTIVNL